MMLSEERTGFNRNVNVRNRRRLSRLSNWLIRIILSVSLTRRFLTDCLRLVRRKNRRVLVNKGC